MYEETWCVQTVLNEHGFGWEKKVIGSESKKCILGPDAERILGPLLRHSIF